MKVTIERPQVPLVALSEIQVGQVFSVTEAGSGGVYIRTASGGVRLQDGITYGAAQFALGPAYQIREAEVIIR